MQYDLVTVKEGSTSGYPPVDNHVTLFNAYRQTRDPKIRSEIVSHYLHLVHQIARRFYGLGESMEDLLQEGAIGLVNAVDLFDAGRGVRFSTYANHLITGQIQHYLRDQGRLIRQPAWVQELNTKISRAMAQLTQELKRAPLPEEIATTLQISEEVVKSTLAAQELNYVVSLTAPAEHESENGTSLLDKETVRSESGSVQLHVEDRIVLEEAIVKLKPLEQQVVRHHFFDDLNQTEIARKLGISVNYSCYLLRRAIAKIKEMLDESPDEMTRAQKCDSCTAKPARPVDAVYDPVTGLYSASYIRIKIEEQIERCQRSSAEFALMIAQTEGRKNNDQDVAVLTLLSQRIRTTIRIVDSVAYLGQGRFCLLLPQTGRQARILGERLCDQWLQQTQKTTLDTPCPALSFGFAVYPHDGSSVNALFSRAEVSLVTPCIGAGKGA